MSGGKRTLVLVVGVPLVLLGLYCLVRNPEWRAVDLVRLENSWFNLWYRVALTPQMKIEPRLIRMGFVRPSAVPVELGWGSMILNPGDLVDRAIMTSGWEGRELEWVRANLRAGDTFVDVGAHHGLYSIHASKIVGSEGRVIAVEPNPPSLERLRANIALNRLANVTVEPVAFGQAEGKLRLYSSASENTALASLAEANARQAGESTQSVDVPVIPMDVVMARLGAKRIGVIKIDTEGAEVLVLRGATETLRMHRPVLVMEVVDHQLRNLGSSLAELEALLAAAGYRQADKAEWNALWVPKEKP